MNTPKNIIEGPNPTQKQDKKQAKAAAKEKQKEKKQDQQSAQQTIQQQREDPLKDDPNEGINPAFISLGFALSQNLIPIDVSPELCILEAFKQ
ncbi:MAG: hypothetical protein EZS28_040744, partial [Streblomastix strix]